jgi:glycosyltransferase involved in cell wall biosynthesis
MGVSDRKIAQIASGIDTELFSSKPKCDIDRLRDQIGLGREDFVLCYFGPISTLRGFDTVLEAFSILRNSVANARLLILARQEPLRKSPTDLDELPGVIFVTENLKPSQVVEFLSASDVVVLPFKFWPNNECPLTILEAMASGTAVVTTPIPLVEDVITNGVNGFVVPPRDPNALARLLKALAKDEDKVMTVGANARQYALANCGWSVVADRTLDLFSHLMTLD